MVNLRLTSLRRLIDAGVPLSTVDTLTTGNTALHWAVSFASSEDVIKHLIEHGADVNFRNTNGAVPMHEAVKQKSETVIRILLEAGAKMDIIAEKGKFCGKSPQDIVLESGKSEHDLQESSITDLRTESTSTLANGSESKIAEVHLSRNKNDICISNSSLEDNEGSVILEENANALSLKNETIQSTNSLTTKIQSLEEQSLIIDSNRITSTSPIPPLITDERLNLLWPQPKHVHQLSGNACRFKKRMALSVSPGPVSVHK